MLVAYLLCVSVLPFAALLIVAMEPYWQPDIDVHQLTLDSFNRFFSTVPTSSASIARRGYFDSLKLAAHRGDGHRRRRGDHGHLRAPRRRQDVELISGVTKVPAAVSGLVIAVAILLTFAGPPFRLHGTLLILLLAYLVVFIPQASIAAEVSRSQVGEDLIEAAAMSGISRFRTTFGILWPLMRPGLAFGWALVFVLAMGDLEVAAILAGPGNPVVGTAFQAIFGSGVYSDLAALGRWSR